MPGVAGVFTFDSLRRWMKPLPVFGAAPPGLAARVRVRHPAHHPVRALPRPRRATWARSWPWSSPTAATAPRTRPSASRWSGNRCPAVVDMIAAAEPGAPLVHPACGTQRRPRLHPRHRRRPTRPSPAPTSSCEETFRIQRYVGMPLEGRGVVAAWDRRDAIADHLEQHAGLPLRPAGAGHRPGPAAAQDPRDRARPGRRLRHQGLGLSRGRARSRSPPSRRWAGP